MEGFLYPFFGIRTVAGRMLAVSSIPGAEMEQKPGRTTIGLRNATKEKLDKNKAPGQCYDGFLCQLVDLWEKTNEVGVVDRNDIRRTRLTRIGESPEDR